MDRYTKTVLSIIAVGVLGINYHLFKGEIISTANASSHNKVNKIAICDENGSYCASALGGLMVNNVGRK